MCALGVAAFADNGGAEQILRRHEQTCKLSGRWHVQIMGTYLLCARSPRCSQQNIPRLSQYQPILRSMTIFCWCPTFRCEGRRLLQPPLAGPICRRSYLSSLVVALARSTNPGVAYLFPQEVALSLVSVGHDGTAEQNAYG